MINIFHLLYIQLLRSPLPYPELSWWWVHLYFQFKDLYYHHKVGFKIAFLCFYCVGIISCYSWMSALWSWPSAWLLFVFLNLCLGIWIWRNYRSECQCLGDFFLLPKKKKKTFYSLVSVSTAVFWILRPVVE